MLAKPLSLMTASCTSLPALPALALVAPVCPQLPSLTSLTRLRLHWPLGLSPSPPTPVPRQACSCYRAFAWLFPLPRTLFPQIHIAATSLPWDLCFHATSSGRSSLTTLRKQLCSNHSSSIHQLCSLMGDCTLICFLCFAHLPTGLAAP